MSKDPEGQCSQEPTDELQQDMDISSRTSKFRSVPQGRGGAKCGGFLFLLVQNGYQVQVDQIDLNVARSEEKRPFPGEMTFYEGFFVKRSSGWTTKKEGDSVFQCDDPVQICQFDYISA